MMLRSIISSRLFLLCLSSLVTIACTGKGVKASKLDSKESIEEEEFDPHSNKELIVTFKNERTQLSYKINPNDEDLYIKLSGGEVAGIAPAAQQLERSNSQPIQVTQTVQSPQAPAQITKAAEVTEPKEDSMSEDLKRQLEPNDTELQKVGLPPEDATDRVLSDIRKAQEALYKNDLGNAEKLVRNSLGIKETAEGFSLLGSIHYIRKDKARAVDSWKRSLELDPNNQDVREMIFQIDRLEK